MELPLDDRRPARARPRSAPRPGQVASRDSTTVCFYKLASAALDLRPGRDQIVTDYDNFPTDRYVARGPGA